MCDLAVAIERVEATTGICGLGELIEEVPEGRVPVGYRLPARLKVLAQVKAEADGVTLTDILIGALEEYVHAGAPASR